MTPPFRRTSCACPEDVDNCRRQPGYLIPSDLPVILEQVSARTGSPPDLVALTLFSASEGALVGQLSRDCPGSLEIFEIPTITPARDPTTGHCVFLRDDRCTIHAVAPFGCAYFDAHMSRREANERSEWGLREILRTPGYARLRDLLTEAERSS